MSDFMKCSCHLCGGHIEYPVADAGRAIACPHCQASITLAAPPPVPPPAPDLLPNARLAQCPDCGATVSRAAVACPKCGCPFASPAASKAKPEPVKAGIRTKSETFGVGCLIQLAGVIALFIFPIGTIIGVALLICGHVACRFPVCTRCGTRLTNRRVAICPGCHAQFP